MNWDELKKIVSSSDKIIIVDKGEPSFVITTFDYYKKHFESSDSKFNNNGEENPQVDKIKSVDRDDLSIDDLPF